jgi:hypothetical protein
LGTHLRGRNKPSFITTNADAAKHCLLSIAEQTQGHQRHGLPKMRQFSILLALCHLQRKMPIRSVHFAGSLGT